MGNQERDARRLGRCASLLRTQGIILVSVLGLASCTSEDWENTKETMSTATSYVVDKTTQVSSVIWETTTDAFGRIDSEQLQAHLGNAYDSFVTSFSSLMDQTGYLFSDQFGDPADNAAAYEALALIDGCEHAVEIIQNASEATKISANYLLALAKQESGCRSDAKASSSSAVGMFQFVEATWLGSMHQHGATYGEAQLASNIELNEQGRPYVSQNRTRQRILAKRTDAQLSAYLAAELARANASYITSKRDRSLAPTDLYLGHFLGPRDAVKFLKELDRRPGTDAHQLLPRAAKANPYVFFEGGDIGQPRSVREVYAFFQGKIEVA